MQTPGPAARSDAGRPVSEPDDAPWVLAAPDLVGARTSGKLSSPDDVRWPANTRAGAPEGAPGAPDDRGPDDRSWPPLANPGRSETRRWPIIEIEACRASDEAELARLRTQVAWLQAERAALWWAVGHDELTGLANRRLFQTLAPSLLGDHPGEAVVVVLDLNGFKPVNDRLGHDAGDLVLRLVAERLARCGDDLVARFGGDEFAAVLTGPPDCDRWWEPAVKALS
jgi:Diguanylate cyclase, GGDEF domain